MKLSAGIGALVGLSSISWWLPGASAQDLFPARGTKLLSSSGPRAVSADFDGDGYLDFAVSTPTSPTGLPAVAIYLNDRFRGQTLAGTYNATSLNNFFATIATDDLNHDGHPDVVAGCYPFEDPRVLLNDGDGTFTYSGSIPTYDGRGVSLGDVNGDGHVDVLTSNYNGETVDLHLGDGNGAFAFSLSLDVPFVWQPIDAETVDLDADGDRDVVVVTLNSTGVHVFLNNDDGTFAPAYGLSTGTSAQAHALVRGDIDGDGKEDVISLNGNSSSGVLGVVLAGNAPPASMLALPIPTGPSDLAIRDMDRDGILDAVVHGSTEIDVLIGTGLGGTAMFAAPIRYEEGVYGTLDSVLANDFDDDGLADVAYTTRGDALIVLYGDGDGELERPSTIALDSRSRGAVLGDVDGDGDEDVVVSLGDTDGTMWNGLRTFFNDGEGAFSGPVETVFAANEEVDDLNAGDFDDDGVLDVVGTVPLANVPNKGEVALWRGTRTGAFASAGYVQAPAFCVEARLIDLDLDGSDDLVARGVTSAKAFYVWRNLGGGTWSAPATYTSPHAVAAFALADFNHDGLPDVATAAGTSSSNTIYANVGNATFSMINFLTPGGGDPQSVALGDVNGDGHLDLLSHSTGGGIPSRLRYHAGNGQGAFGPATVLAVDEGYETLVADADGDGIADVLTASGGLVMLYRGVGSGSFSNGEGFVAAGWYATSGDAGLRSADLNADGRIDFVRVVDRGFAASSLAIMLNRGGDFCSATVFCEPKINSAGCALAIGYDGCPSATAGSGFTITGADAVNNKLGRIFYSFAGPNDVPFLGGVLCAKQPLLRTNQISSGGSLPPANDCTGLYSMDFNAFIASGAGSPQLQIPGTVVHCQWWGRDPQHADPHKVQLSNGLSFIIRP